jgi:hypothetical protein
MESLPAMAVVLPGFSVVEECVYDVEELRYVFLLSWQRLLGGGVVVVGE